MDNSVDQTLIDCFEPVQRVEDDYRVPLETNPRRVLIEYNYTDSPIIHDLSKKSIP